MCMSMKKAHILAAVHRHVGLRKQFKTSNHTLIIVLSCTHEGKSFIFLFAKVYERHFCLLKSLKALSSSFVFL